MRSLVALTLGIVLAWHATAAAQTFKPIQNPDLFSSEVMRKIETRESAAAATIIAESTGQPAVAQTLTNALQIFEGKKFDLVRKVVDNEIAGALRQIIYYSYVENLGFAYFRFHFKITSNGWILTHFAFKDEAQGLFPKDFIER